MHQGKDQTHSLEAGCKGRVGNTGRTVTKSRTVSITTHTHTHTTQYSCLILSTNNNVTIPEAKLLLNLKVNRCLSTSNILHYKIETVSTVMWHSQILNETAG
jgi:hypothetical protein